MPPLTEAEAAAMIGMKPASLARARRAGEIECVLVDKKPLYSEEHITAFLESKTVRAKPYWLKYQCDAWKSQPETHVYFVKCQGYIKIGRADRPEARLEDLQRACPLEMKLLGAVWAPAGLETALRREFAELRHRGEWFRNEARLRREVRQMVGFQMAVDHARARREQSGP